MTDWMPFAFVLSVGVLTVLGLLLGSVEDAGVDVDSARRAFWATVVLTTLVFVLYLAEGEGWIWY